MMYGIMIGGRCVFALPKWHNTHQNAAQVVCKRNFSAYVLRVSAPEAVLGRENMFKKSQE